MHLSRWLVAGLLACVVPACSDETDPGTDTGSGGAGGQTAGSGGGGGDAVGTGGGGSPGIGGSGGDGGSPPTACELLQEALQEALDAAQAAETIPGVSAQVRSGTCEFAGASGLADLAAGTPVAPGDTFRVGSLTKTFVAATVLQLQTEGLLSLDDTIEAHLPGLLPEGAAITVRQVLNHTSGLPSYTDDSRFADDLIADPGRVWAPEELVAYAASEPLDFDPGTSWSYSNTGYVVAGLVIEAATGDGVASAIRARVLEPLGLAHTFLAGDEADPPGLVRGYVESGTYLDVTNLVDPSSAWTAGALVSNAADLSTFYEALLGGDLLADEELAAMTTWVDAGGGGEYGLGLFRQPSDIGEILGHGGAFAGFQSLAVRTADGEQAYTIVINSGTDAINPVLDALAEVVATPP